MDSRMSQSCRDRRVPFRWQEVMEAVLGMADKFDVLKLGLGLRFIVGVRIIRVGEG